MKSYYSEIVRPTLNRYFEAKQQEISESIHPAPVQVTKYHNPPPPKDPKSPLSSKKGDLNTKQGNLNGGKYSNSQTAPSFPPKEEVVLDGHGIPKELKFSRNPKTPQSQLPTFGAPTGAQTRIPQSLNTARDSLKSTQDSLQKAQELLRQLQSQQRPSSKKPKNQKTRSTRQSP